MSLNKIAINLNPRKDKLDEVIGEIISGYKPLIIIAVVGVLILNVLLHFFVGIKAEIYKNYEKEWKKWQGNYNLLSRLKNETVTLEKRKKEFEKVIYPNVEMAQVLGILFSAMPKNIWLESVNFNNETLTLEGYVVRWHEDYLVTLNRNLIAPLRKSSYFSSKFAKINIKATKKKIINKVEVLNFGIECGK